MRSLAADHQFMLGRAGAPTATEKVEALRRAVALNPFNEQYRSWVGRGYLEMAAERLAATDGGSPEGQAAVLELLKSSETAFTESIAFNPGEYDNYTFLANLYNNMGRIFDPSYYEKAANVAERGIAIERYGPAIRLEHARALEGLGRNDEAITELAYALELAPNYGEAALQLAALHQRAGDFDKALAVLEAVNPTAAESATINAAIQSITASRDAQ